MTQDGEVFLYVDSDMEVDAERVDYTQPPQIDGEIELQADTGQDPPYGRHHKVGAARHASIAASSSAQQHQAAVRRAASSIAARNLLPRTQQQFYRQRLTRR